jgi:glyoxylase-like metal-dependent hydrolase (beta-lactamase superfamily II)
MINVLDLEPGIKEIQTFSNGRQFRAFIVETPEGAVLIDTCLPDSAEELYETLKPMNISMVILTHHHQDHTGGLAMIAQKMPGLEFAAHKLEAEKINVPITRMLNDEDLVADTLRVIHIPGHTAGNIALLHEENRTLLAGDSVFGAGGYEKVLSSPPAVYSENVELARENISRMLKYSFDKAYLSHGEHLLEDAKAQIEELL